MKVCTFCKFLAFLSFCFSTLASHAQYKLKQYGHNTPNTCQSQCNQPSRERTYGIIYSANYQGDFEMLGNTLLRSGNAADMNDNTLGNYRSMVYVDADNVGSTYNSSAASLNLPANSTVEFARIYWGGMVPCRTWSENTAKQIKVRKNTEAYTTWTAARINYHPNDYDRSEIEYLAYIDVTDWLKGMGANANATYWVANLNATTGNFAASGAYGGWTLVVAYKNNTYPFKSIRLYDGYENVFDEGHAYMATINLQNLDVPAGTNSARLGVAVWEGDGSLTGDYTKFNGTKLSGAGNSQDNIWNGTILGQTTSSTRTPNYTNQMSVDIDQFDIGNLVHGGDKTATVVGYTTGDSYYPGLFCFSANFTTPKVTLQQTVKNENGSNFLTPGRLIYTLTATNTSTTTNGLNSFIIDTIPPDLELPTLPTVQISTNNGTTWTTYTSYSVGSANDQQFVKLNIGSGATAANGGTLAPNQKVLLRFFANVLDASEPITNLATVYTHDVNGKVYTDEATTTINPASNSPLPAQFSNFDVSKTNGFAKLDWTTLTEAYNKTFEVQRSSDGLHFITIGLVQGSGSTEDMQQYNYLDPLSSVNSGMVYYRLKLTSIDGNEAYTKVVALKLEGSLNNFTVYPNPFKENIKLTLESDKEIPVKIKVSNAAGQSVWTRTMQLQKGSNVLMLDQLATVKPGTYLLQLTVSDQIFTKQVIKQ